MGNVPAQDVLTDLGQLDFEGVVCGLGPFQGVVPDAVLFDVLGKVCQGKGELSFAPAGLHDDGDGEQNGIAVGISEYVQILHAFARKVLGKGFEDFLVRNFLGLLYGHVLVLRKP